MGLNRNLVGNEVKIMEKSLTVGELRQALENMSDDLPVYIHIPEYVKFGSQEDCMRYVTKAQFVREGSISNACFDIEAGEGFGW